MESLDSQLMDDLLEFFSSDFGEEDDDDIKAGKSNTDNGDRSNHLNNSRSNRRNNRRYPPFSLLPDFVEEELEWISNKDAFPMLESVFDFGPNHASIATRNTSNRNSSMKGNNSINHLSPISVLDNSSNSFNSNASHGDINNGNMTLSTNFKVPGKARSKQGRKRRTDMLGHQFLCWPVHEKQPFMKHGSVSSKPSSTIGRKCLHCGAEKTPQWRAGPLGPKTLCNACGVRYKSGRLCDEYRPASSPTFSSELHSNSHRKIVEMKKQKSPIGGSVLKPEMG